MHTRPSQRQLLEAVSTFLLTSVGPKLEGDKALAFRVLIAANVLSTVASELEGEHQRTDAEYEALRGLVPGARELEQVPPGERRAEVEKLQRALATRLRGEAMSAGEEEAALDALLARCAEAVKMRNPRFELKMEIEGSA